MMAAAFDQKSLQKELNQTIKFIFQVDLSECKILFTAVPDLVIRRLTVNQMRALLPTSSEISYSAILVTSRETFS
ncbi:hypothetical protein FGO68_gene8874 [Halteria grandinella]|uniref:Uncharacterized protein n=1 Tax=Halteria grandinella TaxID=5974 RepID=A0A8J8T247_HALGN|nr:hypothetical protein FGO68_gene8874 [Halteria grandinella]